MFVNCTSLETLNINFNTENVEKMEYMFASCLKLSSLNISSFNTKKCKNFTNIFENDKNLNLYFDYEKCSNLVEDIPEYVNIYNITKDS